MKKNEKTFGEKQAAAGRAWAMKNKWQSSASNKSWHHRKHGVYQYGVAKINGAAWRRQSEKSVWSPCVSFYCSDISGMTWQYHQCNKAIA